MEWKEVTLGDLCEISSSKRIFAKEYQSDGVPFYRGKEIIAKQKGNAISNELFISRNRYEEIKARYGVPQQRELLLTSVGTLGVPYVIKEEEFYFKDGNLTWFRHFNGLDVEYLYYWFLSPYGKNEINTKAIGSTQKALTIDSLSKFDIKIPVNLDDQRRIASILSSLDRKIELNNKINDDLEEMAQAIFKNWFVDFEPFKDGKFVDSELGMIPEGWKVGTLADIAEITMGQSPAGNSLNENREGMIFYQGSSDFGFRFPSIRVFTTEPKRLAVANSVLFSVRAPVGDINVAKEECCIGRGVASIKSKYGHDSYLFYTMKSLHKLFDSFDGEGTVFGSINKKTLSAIQILLPSDGIVEQFNNIASSFDDRIRSLSDESSRLSTLRDTLLPRLMSGELEVPE